MRRRRERRREGGGERRKRGPTFNSLDFFADFHCVFSENVHFQRKGRGVERV